ncbi:hypothetical protein KBA73_01595 [Patescibacteria group bacterium]|nr:hypothetical protein [Patescibacteria group bacterium]
MLSWQRIMTLVRRSPGPLCFMGETEGDEPVVVLTLRAYEALLSSEEQAVSSLLDEEVKRIRIPVRIQPLEPREEMASSVLTRAEARIPAPDLLMDETTVISSSVPTSMREEAHTQASSIQREIPLSSIMTPPEPQGEDSGLLLEEKFYFQAQEQEDIG